MTKPTAIQRLGYAIFWAAILVTVATLVGGLWVVLATPGGLAVPVFAAAAVIGGIGVFARYVLAGD